MKEFNLLSEMFVNTKRFLALSPSNSIGTAGATNLNLSPLNTSRTKKAKFNYAVVALEYILSKRVAFAEFEGDKGVYVEFYDNATPQNVVYKAWFKRNNNTLYTDISEPQTPAHSILPLFLYSVTSLAGMSYTRDALINCLEEYRSSNKVSDGNLFYLSDCFYYDCKVEFSGDDKISWNDSINMDVLKQSARTGQLKKDSTYSTGYPEFFKDLSFVTIQSDDSSVQTSNDANKLKDCIDGKYKLDVCWELDQQSYIPSLSALENFVPSSPFYTLVDLIHYELSEVNKRVKDGVYGREAIKDNFVNTILLGKPGTGKTTLANALGATFGMPVRVVTTSMYTEDDEFKGKTKVSEGGFKFVETKFLDAYKRGGIILLEEFNLANPNIMMSAIGQAIEDPFILDEDGQKEVRRNPFSVVIATMNNNVQGSIEPSDAFTSRFHTKFELDDPTKEDFIEVLVSKGFKKAECRRVYSVYEKILKYLCSPSKMAADIATSVTLRSCIGALKLLRIGRDFKEAIKRSMIGTIAIKDRELAEDVYTNVVEPLV